MRQLIFTKDLKKIEIINAVNNEIAIIEKLNHIHNINKLLLEGNKLEDFPKCEFPNLKILSLKRNPVKDFTNVYHSQFPNIQQLYLDYAEYDEYYTRPSNNNEVDVEKVVLPFEKLKSIQSESNFKAIHILSTKI